jgi:hypothetical protein
MKPGIYSALPMDAYLSMPAVSASLLAAIIPPGCPKAAWYESWLNPSHQKNKEDEDGEETASTKAKRRGSIAHSIMLEGRMDGVTMIDPVDFITKSSGNIPKGFTNKEIKAARDAALGDGKIPVLKDDMGDINAMVASAREYIESVKADEPLIWQAFQPEGGESETTLVWQEGTTACRIRPDRISVDRILIVDYKTGKTSPDPGLWGRTQMVKMGYYMAAAFYRRGVHALCAVTPAYVWLVQSQNPPYLCSLVGLDPHAADLGERKIEAALELWKRCAASGKWPGYPPRVCYPEIPPWEEAAWIEQSDAEDADGIPFNVADVFKGD